MRLDTWELHRRQDGTINLVEAWKDETEANPYSSPAIVFLNLVEEYQPIKSRQVAAVALAQADVIAARGRG